MRLVAHTSASKPSIASLRIATTKDADRGAQCAYAMASRPLVQQQAISANTCLDLGEGRSVAYATAPADSRRRGSKGDR